jgi:bacterial leucyl aminopeptidase
MPRAFSRRRLVRALMMAAVAGPLLAHGGEPPVWITLGADAVPVVREALRAGRAGAPPEVELRGEVALLRVSPGELPRINGVMHESFRRCPGFMAHDSREEALASLRDDAQLLATQAEFLAYTIDNAAVAQGLIAELREAQIRATITTLAGYPTRLYTSATGVTAASDLRANWAALAQGRSDVSVQLFNHAAWAQPSVIATIQGATLPSEIVVMGAHLDSINRSGGGTAPGADDDASGVATLTEVLRVAVLKGYRPSRTVKIMAYAAEEGGLRGSREIATAHRNAGANVVGVLQLDMTNFKGSTPDIVLLSDNTNAPQNQFVEQLVDAYVGVPRATTACGYGCSDHASWTNAGYPASMPFEALFGQHNTNIHTANDTLARSGGTANHSLKFAKLAAAYLAEVAKGGFGGGGGGGADQTAVFDAALQAPKCATAGRSCDSGPTLLRGRDGRGPEPNQPNTIRDSCADGTSGTFHSDESNDRLKVSTVDGTTFAAGKAVRVEATVWAFRTFASDRLDLYRAASANSPTWVLVGTLAPPAAGAQTLSATYTLPAGTLQAVRARFRFQGSASPCASGSFTDHDDLVFAVP